jgi:hypothetical protein
MRVVQHISRVGVCLCLAAAVPTAGFGQQRIPAEAVGGPLTGPLVLDAPFSADATTIVRQTLGDGTRFERNSTARYYRDRAGRVRVEQMIMGLEVLNPAAERHVRITIHPDPATRMAYTVDSMTRTEALPVGRELTTWRRAERIVEPHQESRGAAPHRYRPDRRAPIFGTGLDIDSLAVPRRDGVLRQRLTVGAPAREKDMVVGGIR